MESEAKYTLVGAVIVVMTVVLVAAVLWLGDEGVGSGAERYAIDFKHHSLAGLQKDSDVTMRGIKVGTVESIGISEDNIENVRVVVKLSPDTPVKQDSRAVIRRNLLTGLAWVDITSTTNESPPLKAGPEGAPYPIIPEGKTDLDTIGDSIPDLVDDVGEIAQRANALLSDENVERFSKAIENIEQLTGTLASKQQEIAALIENVSAMSEKLAEASDAWGRVAASADTKLDVLSEDARKMLQTIDNGVERLAAAAASASGAIKSNVTAISLEIEELSRSVSAAAASFGRVASGLEEPREVLFGPSEGDLGPGERRLP
ncbi:MAG: MCE family protein [Bdellovibrionales bacterium]|nr:MCE family protein [Bdellovibrionales bacterium]